ncbi:MAG: acetyl-CoA carboxylase biotin carboxylase subunit [Proteobacteria bacterium]|nr:acetyl-CoA carboxylase biotin carboxylase subunit [Pseudomonadota bacterium]
MFEKILIANRGEIAVRVIRTCKAMGIGTVAVYSEPDFRSIHVSQADEAVLVGGARPTESYLIIDKIIEAALATGCQAIHPGYGFLSENPLFAGKVVDAGLTFIGPPAAVIAAMGDKIAAKKLAINASVPTVPGHSEPVVSLAEAQAAAAEVGYPVLLKPAAGGGGKGMRIVDRAEEMASALQTCQQETRKSFGDARIFVERFIRKPRHIEIQIIADQHGHVVHLGERECSIQRRYQKIIEESPSCALDPILRERIGNLACELAKKAGYVNAGTVEFILDEQGEFFFLEMNTRLQVEHPVTELVNGLDLVELQLRIAAGEVLPFTQEQVALKGWSMEVRVCAEDSGRGFVPSVGLITRYAAPRGTHIRVDSGVDAGSTVSVFYDPLLAKVITWGETREEARRRMVQALNGYHIEGVLTNIDFANQVLTHPVFIRGELSTDFIPTYLLGVEAAGNKPPVEVLHAMALATTLIYHLRENLVQHSLLPLKSRVGVGSQHQGPNEYVTKSEEDIFPIRLENCGSGLQWQILVDTVDYRVVTPPLEFYRRRLRLNINGEDAFFRLTYSGNFIEAAFCGVIRTFEIYNPREWQVARFMPPPVVTVDANILDCPMPGLVVDVKVKAGERVFRGQELVILESMKMESAVSAPGDGVVELVCIKPGDAVETGSVLIHFKKD